MEDERYSADIPRSNGSDPSGPRRGFKLGAKLRARMERLEEWRILPSSIKSPKDAREFPGGHATVSHGFLLGSNNEGWRGYEPREVLQLCRRPPESDDHLRDDEGKLGDNEKIDKVEDGSDSDDLWWGEFVAVKKSRIGDNKDQVRLLGLALREAEFLVRLSHPNIVNLKGYVEDLSKDIIWLVFPWAESGNLKDFVASRDWEIPERISLINDVAKGLEYLHSRTPPICHGDLKSFNVLVNSRHRAVITDFGSARCLTAHNLNKQPGLVQNQKQPLQAEFCTLSKTITLTGNIYTLRWAAPELLNDDQMNPWSDIWALGWISYEILTNSIPFEDVPADAVVVERVIKGDLPSVDEHARVVLFENLCSLMTACWSSNPSERPTAKDYLDTIGDMPMVVPDANKGPHSTFSSEFSSAALMRTGGTRRKFGDSAMAFACFTEAHRIYTRIGDRKGKANAESCLADLHLDRGEYGEAVAHYSEALQIWTDIGDRTGRASALSSLAEVHRLQNEYSEAIVRYSEALQIHPNARDTLLRARTMSNLAQVHRLRNEYSEAIQLYSEALQIHTDIGNMEGIASALGGLAEAHRLRNEFTDAITPRSEGLQIHTEIDDRRARADALCGLAEVHWLLNKYSEAIEHYSEVLQIRTDIGDRTGHAFALSCLAQVHLLRNQYNIVTKIYSEALQICTAIGDRRGKASVLRRLAGVHRDGDRYGSSEAMALYSEVLQISTDVGHMNGRADALLGLAKVHRLRKDYGEGAGFGRGGDDIWWLCICMVLGFAILTWHFLIIPL